jgi:putative membrane protein
MGDLAQKNAANKMGLSSPNEPNGKQKADYDKMSKMTGVAFDRMFARHMIEDHKKDLAEYKKESRQKDAAGEYASGEIDTLQKHLDTAKGLSSHKSANK